MSECTCRLNRQKKNAMNGRVMIVFEAGCPLLDFVCNNYNIITQRTRCTYNFTYTPLLHLYYAKIHVLHYHYFMSPI